MPIYAGLGKPKRCAAVLLALCFAAVVTACGETEVPSSAPAPASSAPPFSAAAEPQVLKPLPVAEGFSALTGLEVAEDLPDGQRPVAVAVSNNQRSYPQRGLAAADIIFEMLTEGGITRLTAVYTDYRTIPLVGPVRSTRDQFLQFVIPIDAIPVHIGGSVYGQNLLAVTGYAEINGLYLGTTVFWFDEQRTLPRPQGKLNEYCWFTSGKSLADGMALTGMRQTGEVRAMFLFDEDIAKKEQAAHGISAAYSGSAIVSFSYNTEDGLYYKTAFGSPHTDEDGGPLAFTNVFLLSCNIGYKPDGLCTDFNLSEGDGWYFTAGGIQPIRWIKGDPQDALRLFDEDNKELLVQKGKSYIGIVPAGTPDAVTWQPAVNTGG